MRARSVVALLVVAALVVVPAGQAYHYSVGTQDASASPQETPQTPDTPASLYERGVATDCPRADANLSQAAQSAPQNLQNDPFCGRLVYHEDTNKTQISPPDQDLLFDDWTFDVVLTQYVGSYGLGTCYPWCAPGGVTVLDAIEGPAQTLAPQVFAGDHEDEQDPGHQSYAIDARLPAAGSVLQDAGVGQASGWMLPTTDPTFVGFLEDGEGLPIDESAFTGLVDDLKGSQLPSDVAPLVCGFSPDFEAGGPTEDAPLTSSSPSACDVVFTWRGEETDTAFGPEEDDRCASATYVCGTLTPAWYGQLACSGWIGCQPAHQAGDAWHSTYDYDVWHFVAAPAPSDCNGDQEPGFRTSVAGPGPQAPYLAHDLDVYTPPTSSQQAGALGELPEAWSDQAIPPAAEQAGQGRAEPGEDARTTLASTDAPPPAPDAYRAVHKRPIPEPNAPADTSQSIAIEREPGPCQGIGDQAEQVLDPWVNQIDTRQRLQTWNGMHASTLEPYLDTGANQDQNNRPGPGFYLTDGMVGMFTDRDDDGSYEQASAEALFSDVQAVGAYPMFYDMHLDEDLEPAGGCQAGFAQRPIAEAMDEAGYGPRTGLIEAVYLAEPTALFDRRTGEVHPYPEGNTIFLAQTQAIKALADAGDPTVEDAIEQTIEATGAPEDARIVPLDEVTGQPSDFWEQCGEATGRYVQEMMFLHDCTLDCSGDTIATTYLFEVDDSEGVIGGAAIPAFQPDGRTPYAFGQGTHTWTDVDPFDGDPERNTRDGTPAH